MPKSSTDRRHFIIAGVLVVIATVLMDILLKSALPLPLQASIEALTIDQLIGWHLTVIAFLFSLVLVFMLYAIVIFRRREGDDSEGEHFEGNTPLEIAWTVLPLILVLIFGYIGVVDLNKISEKNEQLTIKATGVQWAWTFEYEGGVLSQELMLPVDKRVRVQLRSTDVIHSFWIPEFRVKQDLLPAPTEPESEAQAYPSSVYFTPTTVGEYTLECAELCGLSHYRMLATVKVVAQEEFTAWLQTEQVKVNDQSAVAELNRTSPSQ
ncbi:MAG: cytochrome c oxidase subunit II [Caldilineaceae bacterium]|nr:cytochrome c oxidase subunit II [Caldilineaceae bacterium]